MNKYLIPSIILFIASVALAWIVSNNNLFSNSHLTEAEKKYESVEEHDHGAYEGQIMTGKGSLLAMIDRGVVYECTVSYEGPGVAGKIEGSYFTANGMLRGDFLVPDLAPDAVSSIILRDGFLYTWVTTAGKGYGVKRSLATGGEINETGVAENLRTPVPLDEPLDFSCQHWLTVDNSVFEPPADVLFQPHETLSEAGMEYGTVYEPPAGFSIEGKSPCDLCQQIAPGPGQDECKRNFQC